LEGFRWNQAFTIGFGLNERGAVEINIATIVLETRSRIFRREIESEGPRIVSALAASD